VTVLVTGALGAIGAWTVRAPLDRGRDVVTYDLGEDDHRLRPALSEDELGALVRIPGDVSYLAQLERAMEDHGVTAVIHLAALQVPLVRADPFGGALRLQYVADAGEAVVRASEANGRDASVHNLDGPVVTVAEIVAAIERAAPDAAGLITADETPLPFPASVDAASFVALAGGRVSRPLDEGVAEAIARFRAG
jgi:nucleoside-diphosphate-sugar epimerase